LRPSDMVAISDAPLGATYAADIYGWTDFSREVGFYDYQVESEQDISPPVEGVWGPIGKRNVVAAMRKRHSRKWNVVFCDGHVQPLQRGSLVEGEFGQSDVVVGQGADFSRARGRQVFLELQDLKVCTFAVFEFLLLGFQRVLGVTAGFPGGLDPLKACDGNGDGIFDLYQDGLFQLLQLQRNLRLGGFGGLVIVARPGVAQWQRHLRARRIKGTGAPLELTQCPTVFRGVASVETVSAEQVQL